MQFKTLQKAASLPQSTGEQNLRWYATLIPKQKHFPFRKVIQKLVENQEFLEYNTLMNGQQNLDVKYILRKEYLSRLNNLKHKKLIKIVTGIRRCGKSTVLQMFRNQLLKSGVKEEQIIFINFEDFENNFVSRINCMTI